MLFSFLNLADNLNEHVFYCIQREANNALLTKGCNFGEIQQIKMSYFSVFEQWNKLNFTNIFL